MIQLVMKQITLRLSDEDFEKVGRLAEVESWSVSRTVVTLVGSGLKSYSDVLAQADSGVIPPPNSAPGPLEPGERLIGRIK